MTLPSKKTIVFVSSQNAFNPTSGAETRVAGLVDALSKSNDLHIYAPAQKGVRRSNYRPLPYSSRFSKLVDFRIIRAVRELRKSKRIDLVYATTLWSGINAFLVRVFTGVPYYFDNHNIEFLRFKRTGSWMWPLVYLLEAFIVLFAKKVVCVSETDKKYAVRYLPISKKDVVVFENPVNTAIFFPDPVQGARTRKLLKISPKEKFLLFFGQLDYAPNVEAVRVLRDEIIPRLDASGKLYRLVICGKGDAKGELKTLKHPKVRVEGLVSRIQDYINAADVVVVPLISGSGTRLKILEALACKKKVVSTSKGAEGIASNTFLKIADDWSDFGRLVVQ